MTEDEIETLRSLPETVSVYRGVTSYNAGKVKALSWTLGSKGCPIVCQSIWRKRYCL